MAATEISVALAEGADNAITFKDTGLFAPKIQRGVTIVGTGHVKGTPPEAPHFHVDIPVPGAQQGDYAILNDDINKDKEAQWAITYRCAADKVIVGLHRLKDGQRPFYTIRALVLRVPTALDAAAPTEEQPAEDGQPHSDNGE